MQATFKDHFSRQAADYSRYRPGYPPELIAWIASRAPDRALAVDCATGNGQAAVAEQVMGYLATWSAVQRFREANPGDDPLPDLEAELATLWRVGVTLRLNWPVHLRLGRN